MYKVLLVDDEFMIVEGLKKLIPFKDYQMEVVAGVYSGQAALEFAREQAVDVVITDVHMPDMTGLELIGQLQEILPDASYVILSGYKEFDYVRAALNLQVADYLVKPVDKVELGQLLGKIQQERTCQAPNQALSLLKGEGTEQDWQAFLAGKGQLWLGAGNCPAALASLGQEVLGQDLSFFLTDTEPEDSIYHQILVPPYQASYKTFRRHLKKKVFYGRVAAQDQNSAFAYYEPMYRVILQGNINQILEELHLLEEVVRETTPSVSATKQLFIQFVMDVFHLFNHLEEEDLTQLLAQMEQIDRFDQLTAFIEERLTALFDHYRMNDNVAKAMAIIARDYQEELTLKEVSKRLYVNSVYLGQLIKRETNASFSELLNKQRIKAAQQLLLSTGDSIEDVCYAVGYGNVGYFYKVFRKHCGQSPKAYRQQMG